MSSIEWDVVAVDQGMVEAAHAGAGVSVFYNNCGGIRIIFATFD